MSTPAKRWAVPPEVVESLAREQAAFPFPDLEDLPARPTVHQAAVALQVADLTIRRYVANKTLKAFRVGPRAIRIDKESLIKLASQPIADED